MRRRDSVRGIDDVDLVDFLNLDVGAVFLKKHFARDADRLVGIVLVRLADRLLLLQLGSNRFADLDAKILIAPEVFLRIEKIGLPMNAVLGVSDLKFRRDNLVHMLPRFFRLDRRRLVRAGRHSRQQQRGCRKQGGQDSGHGSIPKFVARRHR